MQGNYSSKLHGATGTRHVSVLNSRFGRSDIGQEVEVHYRWHPLYGRRVKVRDVERRGGGQVVHVEADAGVVRMVTAWMLDAAICSAMVLGEPRVTVAAHCIICINCWPIGICGETLRTVPPTSGRNAMGNLPNAVPAAQQSLRSMPRQMNLTFDAVELQGINAVQRANTLKHLTCLLMHAPGISTAKGRDDDE